MKRFKFVLLFTMAVLLLVTLGMPAGNNGLIPTASAADKKEKVIIDADMGQLNDDAYVMYMLANSDHVDVLGVTTVAGNTWVEEGTAYALRQLELIGRKDIPVVMGAGEALMGNRMGHLDAEEKLYGNTEYMGSYSRPRPASYLQLAKEPYGGYPKTKPLDTTAVDFIVDQVKKNPNEVTIFALGPATNLALAVKKNPEIVPMVKQVIYMGGAIDIPGNTTPAAEFNWWYDPESIKIALRTPFKRQIVVPNDIAEKFSFNKKIYDRIVSHPETPIVKQFKDLKGPQFQNNPQATSYVWDAITAAVFLDPKIITKMEKRYIDIDTNYGPNYGRAIGYHESRRRDFTHPENFPAGTQLVDIVFDIDQEAFWDIAIGLLTKKK
ncbi:nucleoside hydrolase [Brevibacillus sp. B_LB10_24]|uniref:nucleoside hydrolase n=1 Tax=Brevibacillus sp. B_LB10_24 TaxID=3380645 RepID=UPI0038B8CFDF